MTTRLCISLALAAACSPQLLGPAGRDGGAARYDEGSAEAERRS
jgi:hypothetical protein